MSKCDTVVYAGTFDPVTNGHLDTMLRALSIFSRVVVAVARSEGKAPLFSLEERVGMVRDAVRPWPEIQVEGFDGLLVDYLKSKGMYVVLRGLRAYSDFEHEFQMALTNRKLYDGIRTIFMMPSEEFVHVSSHMVKEVASLGGDVSRFVPENVAQRLAEVFRSGAGKRSRG